MSALEYVLDGLEAALELERELGVRVVECDRSVLAPPMSAAPQKVPTSAELQKVGMAGERPPLAPRPSSPIPHPSSHVPHPSAPLRDLVFLHHEPLPPKGVEMMAKIITAMGRTAENAPVVAVPPVPNAKVVVVLGSRAMKMFFPEMKAEPGQWLKATTGADVLVTYSPEYVLRFATVTPAVQEIKKAMWQSLKAVVQRLK